MSWFKRKREFAEEADALADDVDTEFDNIAEGLNGLFQAGAVTSSAVVTAGVVGGEGSVPGSTKTITVDRPGLAIISSIFNIEISSGTSTGKVYVQGYLYVDGSKQPHFAELGQNSYQSGPSPEVAQGTVSETYVVQLSEGSHTFKQAHQGFNVGATTYRIWSANYTYLIVPNPSP